MSQMLKSSVVSPCNKENSRWGGMETELQAVSGPLLSCHLFSRKKGEATVWKQVSDGGWSTVPGGSGPEEERRRALGRGPGQGGNRRREHSAKTDAKEGSQSRVLRHCRELGRCRRQLPLGSAERSERKHSAVTFPVSPGVPLNYLFRSLCGLFSYLDPDWYPRQSGISPDSF